MMQHTERRRINKQWQTKQNEEANKNKANYRCNKSG